MGLDKLSATIRDNMNTNKKVYLACPYTCKSKSWVVRRLVHWWRFRMANKAAAELMKQGYCVFSPISMSHPIAVQCTLPGTWDFWQNQDMPFIAWCDEFHIVCIRGWDKSTGIKAEKELAERLGKKIVFIEY